MKRHANPKPSKNALAQFRKTALEAFPQLTVRFCSHGDLGGHRAPRDHTLAFRMVDQRGKFRSNVVWVFPQGLTSWTAENIRNAVERSNGRQSRKGRATGRVGERRLGDRKTQEDNVKRCWIEYSDSWKHSPMAYWVHVESGELPWFDAEEFDPPAPSRVPGKGYPILYVEIDGFTFTFGSEAELDHCVEVLSQKLLPSSSGLTRMRGDDRYGPNRHWISRLPAKVKAWKYREPAIQYLLKARVEFETARSTD